MITGAEPREGYLRAPRSLLAWVALAALVGTQCTGADRPAETELKISQPWTQSGRDATHSGDGAEEPVPPLVPHFTYRGEPWCMSQAVAAEDTILISCTDVHALDRRGRLKWRVEGGGDGLSAPVLIPPLVVVAEATGRPPQVTVTALDIGDGEQQWSWSAPAPDRLSEVVLAATGEGVVALSDGRSPRLWMLGLDGELRWEAELEGRIRFFPDPPAVDEEVVVAVTEAGAEAFAASDGTPLWREPATPASQQFGGPVIAGDLVVVQEEKLEVDWCLRTYRKVSGRLERELCPGVIPFSFRVFGDRVYMEEQDDPQPFLSSLTLPDLTQEWRIPRRTGEGSDAFDAFLPLAGGVLGSQFQHLFFFDPEDGLTWKISFRESGLGQEIGRLMSTGDGVLLTTRDGMLRAFVPDRSENDPTG